MEPLKKLLTDALVWHHAHIDLLSTLRAVPLEKTGFQAPGLPYTLWQLVEHIRITQKDIVDFTLNDGYEPIDWPADYWPEANAPASEKQWKESIDEIASDLARMNAFVRRDDVGLGDRIPIGDGQTVLREILLIIDHNAYHLGQLVLLLRLAGAWER